MDIKEKYWQRSFSLETNPSSKALGNRAFAILMLINGAKKTAVVAWVVFVVQWKTWIKLGVGIMRDGFYTIRPKISVFDLFWDGGSTILKQDHVDARFFSDPVSGIQAYSNAYESGLVLHSSKYNCVCVWTLTSAATLHCPPKKKAAALHHWVCRSSRVTWGDGDLLSGVIVRRRQRSLWRSILWGERPPSESMAKFWVALHICKCIFKMCLAS